MKRWLSLFLIICLIILISCAAKRLAQIDIPNPKECLHTADNGEIMLCADPIFIKEDILAYYGIDLLSKGWFPVKISISNIGAETISIEKKGVVLIFDDKVFVCYGANEAFKDTKASVTGRTIGWGAAFGVIGGSLAYTSARNRNEAVSLALYSKQFFFGKIPVNETRKGLVYFKVDKDIEKKLREKGLEKKSAFIEVRYTFVQRDSENVIRIKLE